MSESIASEVESTTRDSVPHSSATDALSGTDSRSTDTELSPVPFQLDDLSASAQAAPPSDQTLGEVELDLRIELGRTRMRLEDVLQLRPGSVVTLDCGIDDPVEVFVNNRLIARGEILVMDNRFCVRIAELVGG